MNFSISNKSFLDTKINSKKGIKSFFPSKFREHISNDQQIVSLNAMNLYNGRNKIIGLFENKAISPSIYVHDAKSDGVEESEQKFDESIEERVKLRRQKADDKTDDKADNDDEKSDTTDMLDLESEESATQKRIKKGQVVKILTPQKMLSRLPIRLAQLKQEIVPKNLRMK